MKVIRGYMCDFLDYDLQQTLDYSFLVLHNCFHHLHSSRFVSWNVSLHFHSLETGTAPALVLYCRNCQAFLLQSSFPRSHVYWVAIQVHPLPDAIMIPYEDPRAKHATRLVSYIVTYVWTYNN
jgi:hypothetical protein